MPQKYEISPLPPSLPEWEKFTSGSLKVIRLDTSAVVSLGKPLDQSFLEHTQPMNPNGEEPNLYARQLMRDYHNNNELLGNIKVLPNRIVIVEILSNNGLKSTTEFIGIARPEKLLLYVTPDKDNPRNTLLHFPQKFPYFRLTKARSDLKLDPARFPSTILYANAKYLRQPNSVFMVRKKEGEISLSNETSIEEFWKKILQYKLGIFDAQTLAAIYRLEIGLNSNREKMEVPNDLRELLNGHIINSFAGVLNRNPWFTIESIETANGKREIIKVADNEALIVPVELVDSEVFINLNVEPSPAQLNKNTLIVPGGGVIKGEKSEVAAKRELDEELGIQLTDENIIHLGDIKPTHLVTGRASVVLAYSIKPFVKNQSEKAKQEADEQFIVRHQRLTLAQIEDLITKGKLNDARTIAAIAMAKEYLRGNDLLPNKYL